MLAQATQPAQEQWRFLLAFSLSQQAGEEDGQLVQYEQDAGVVVGEGLDECFALLPPSVVASGAELHAELVGAQFLDVLLEPAPERSRQAASAGHTVGFLGDGADEILRRGRIFNVHKEELPAIAPQTLAQCFGNAGLAHAPLSGEQDVGAAAHPRFEQAQLRLAVEEALLGRGGADL